jgi:hypothetical protein
VNFKKLTESYKRGYHMGRLSQNRGGILMRKSVKTIGIVCILVTAGFLGFITFKSDVVGTAGATIYVDDDNVAGPWDGTLSFPYRTIQDGINNTSEGDTR